MMEREHGAERKADAAVEHPAGLEPVASQERPAPKPARLMPQPDKGLSFPAALDEAMRDHQAVFAALAK